MIAYAFRFAYEHSINHIEIFGHVHEWCMILRLVKKFYFGKHKHKNNNFKLNLTEFGTIYF